jgi:hypothetical protein
MPPTAYVIAAMSPRGLAVIGAQSTIPVTSPGPRCLIAISTNVSHITRRKSRGTVAMTHSAAISGATSFAIHRPVNQARLDLRPSRG